MEQDVGDVGITTRVIRVESEWDAIESSWDALWGCSPTASATTSYVWLRTWWRVYQSSVHGRLRLVTVWRDTALIGALPLYEARRGGGILGLRVLQFIGTGEAEFEEVCSDYLNLLLLPGEESTAVTAVWDAIASLSWDLLELLDLPDDSPLCLFPSPVVRAELRPRGKCPIAGLESGFEAYLGRLSQNSRQQARRLLREASDADVSFDLIGFDEAPIAFDDLIHLHQARWVEAGKPGVFAAPRFVTFHRSLVAQWLPFGRAVLARLSLDGQSVAVLYGFIAGGRFEFYQSGTRITDQGPLRSPGNLAHLLLMRELSERGVTAYDFLRGSSSYKERLATTDRTLMAVCAWRRTLRATGYRAIRTLGRFVRTMISRLTRTTM